jgi:hypothetical protein
MSEALVLGSTPQSIALKKVLGLCTDWHVCAPVPPPKWLTPAGKALKQHITEYRREVRAYDIVIGLSSLLRQVSDVISLVHRLRKDLCWEGCFIAVMMSEPQAERLRQASFIGEPIDKTCFGQVSGHVALTIPLRISELTVVWNEPTSVSLEYWHFKLLRSGRAVQLNRQIEKAERALNDPQVEVDIRGVSREIMTSLDTIDWSLVAERGRGHALANSVRSLLQEHGAEEHLTIEDCSVIVKKAKRILAQSTFPFPSED